MRSIVAVQMDPLNVVARSHEIVLWSRVLDFRSECLDQLIYQDREYFDKGFERIYDFCKKVAPARFCYRVVDEVAERYFAWKEIAFSVMMKLNEWKNRLSG